MTLALRASRRFRQAAGLTAAAFDAICIVATILTLLDLWMLVSRSKTRPGLTGTRDSDGH